MKDVIHEPLESLSSITEAIRHVTILIEAKRGNHRRLRNVRRMNWHLMVSFHQVQLGEDGGAMKAGREILEIRKRITVRSGGKIEMAVVAAGPPGSIRLGNKMKRGGPGTVRVANNASRFKFVKLSLCLLETRGIKTASFGKNWRTGSMDMVLHTMIRGKIFQIRRKNSRESLKEILKGWRQIRKRVKKRRRR